MRRIVSRPFVHLVPRAACLALLLAGSLSAQGQAKDAPEQTASPRADSLAGEIAPVGRWYTAGGSASRCGVSAARPDLGERLAPAWEHAVTGVIEEEPLVWDETVVLVTAAAPKPGGAAKERTLHVLRLSDGKPLLPPRKVASEVPIAPSMWGRLIAYRDGKNAIRVDQIGATQLVQRMRYVTEGEVSAPLLFGSEIYYTQGGQLERIDLGAQKPAWSIEGSFRGRASLLGDHVFALRFARVTEATLALVDRFTGKVLAQEGSGTHGHGTDASTDAIVAVSRLAALARYEQRGMAVSTDGAGDIELNAAIWGRRSAVGSEKLVSAGSAASYVMPCLQGSMTMLFVETDAAVAGWVMMWPRKRGWMMYPVANQEHYPDIMARRVPCTLLGDAAVVGDLAFDRETLRILWRGDLEPTQRTVPARGTLLVSTAGKLVAVRDARAATPLAGQGTQDVKKGVAVLTDGRVVRGPMQVDRGAATLAFARTASSKGEVVSLDRVLWVEDGEVAMHFGDRAAVVRSLAAMVEDQMRTGYAGLARKAVRSNDPRLITRLLVEALELGADEKEVVAAQRQVEALRRGALRLDAGAVRDVEAKEAELRNAVADVAWRRAQALPAAAPGWLRWLLPEIALSFDPRHPGVSAWVRSELPAGMPVPEPFVVQQWLHFAQAAKQRPMRVLAAGDDAYAFELEQLAKAKASWREDLLAVCSERMCVLAPKQVAGVAARCLATGELVIDALEAMFGGIGHERAGNQRLLIKLYATQEEYVDRTAREVLAFVKAQRERERAASKEAGEDSGEAPAAETDDPKAEAERLLGEKQFLGLTAGLFVIDEGVTRLFMQDGKEGYDRSLSTFAHELTHHWLELRGPRFQTPAEAKPRIVVPGYWIVEGFASFVQSFVWDVEARSWRTEAGNERTDFFAAASNDQLNRWSTQLTVNHASLFRRFSTDRTMFIRRPRYLGDHSLSQWSMFYCQGAAACHYLYHAEDGKHRKALLEYVVNYYSRCPAPLAPDTAFGMSADELGAKVVAYVKSGN